MEPCFFLGPLGIVGGGKTVRFYKALLHLSQQLVAFVFPVQVRPRSVPKMNGGAADQDFLLTVFPPVQRDTRLLPQSPTGGSQD